jgi:hypothetical protein
VSTPFARRIRTARRLAGLGLVGLAALAATTSPALAGGSARPSGHRTGKTITLRYYSVVVSLVHTRADGTVVQGSPHAPPAVGDQLEVTELAYKGTHQSHAKKWSSTSHTICVFKTAKGAPTCDGQAAVGGNQMLLFHTPAGSDPIVSGGTGRYAGATGEVTATQVRDTNNSDIVVVVHLRN